VCVSMGVFKDQHSRVAAEGRGSGDLNLEEVFMVRALW